MDIVSYILGQEAGKKEGEKTVNIDSDYIFTDINLDGNIVIEAEANNG